MVGAALVLGVVLAEHAVAEPGEGPGDRRPNIVLMFADDVGYGDLSCYGHPTIHTPELDQLAAEGTRFTSFYANPTCTPARAALLTGRHPVRSGMGGIIWPNSDHGLSGDEITIATALKGEGYRTKCVGKWHLGHAEEEFMPTSHGFDEYFGLLYSNDMMLPWNDRGGSLPLELYRNTEPIEHPVDQSTLTMRYTEEAVRFIHENAEESFFLYLPYTMPHVPLATAEQFQGQSRAGLYGDVVEALDWSAGQVMDALREVGVADNTLVIWLSDNGPWHNIPGRYLGKEGPDGLVVKRWHSGSAGPFRNSKGSTYEGGVRVPAIVWWPGEVPSGRIIQEPANSMDLFTTILRACGAEVPDDRPIDGNDLLPLLRGETDESPTQVHYYFSGNDLQAVRKGPWKLRTAGRPELFHLERDYMERFNVADDHPEKVEELRALIDEGI